MVIHPGGKFRKGEIVVRPGGIDDLPVWNINPPGRTNLNSTQAK